jgi:uncharacterized protein (TIGR00645 family)
MLGHGFRPDILRARIVRRRRRVVNAFICGATGAAAMRLPCGGESQGRETMSFRGKLEDGFEAVLFASRWLMAPIYLGLVIALAALAVIFVKELLGELWHIWDVSEQGLVVWILTLIDMSLAGNLLLMVIFAGYENFVSKMEAEEHHPDRPHWMGRVDFSNMKLKLVASIIAISVIELLKIFMSIDTVNKVDLMWLLAIHITFVVSGVLLAVMDRLGERGLGDESE